MSMLILWTSAPLAVAVITIGYLLRRGLRPIQSGDVKFYQDSNSRALTGFRGWEQ